MPKNCPLLLKLKVQQRLIGEHVQNAVVPVEREIHDEAVGRFWKLNNVFHRRV